MTVIEFPNRRPEPWLSRAELATHLSVNEKTVDRWRKQGMPSELWGKKMRRFRVSEVEDWLKGRAA